MDGSARDAFIAGAVASRQRGEQLDGTPDERFPKKMDEMDFPITAEKLDEIDEQYIAHKNKTFPAQLDITAPDHGVQVEYDRNRKVLYVHVDGYTALRICRIPGSVEFSGDCHV